MRLIVTGHDDLGRSIVVSDQQLADTGMVSLFTANFAEPDVVVAAADPHIASVPTSGSASWMLVDVSPEDQMRAALAQGVVGIDADGWHTTPTIDYVQITNGTITLALDTAEVELHAGDCVVQRATRHAWRNHTTAPVRLAALMVSL